MYTLSEENYLKAIFHLERQFQNGVSTNAVAEEMETKASSVTDMVKRLSDKKLVIYKKYQGVKLSTAGTKAAVEVIRKHRLWEVFLVNKLNFNWDEVHELAEQLEHIKSPKLIQELDRFLEYPKFDPHGDPIPNEDGKFHKISKILLAECAVGETGILVGVKDSSASFLQFLDKNKLSLGIKIKVENREDFDNSLQITAAGNQLTVSNKTAANMYLKLE